MGGTSSPPTAAETACHRWRFSIVLSASLSLAVVQPLTSGRFGDQGSFDIFFSLLIGAVLLLVPKRSKHGKYDDQATLEDRKFVPAKH
jgi:hypothetical protein